MDLQHFVGTKIVKSKPMTKSVYNDYRGWEMPADEDGAEPGYLVEYLDGGKPNHPDHQGYISWAPKEQHENAYLNMGNMGTYTPEQQRLFAKKVQLEHDIATLKQEINDVDTFHVTDWEIQLMVSQLSCMETTLNIIIERTEWF
jgi:hypothetical protein